MSEAKIDKIPCIFPASREFRFSETGSLETASSSGESANFRFLARCFRRTVATQMAEIGIDPHVIERVQNRRGDVIKGVAAIYNRYEYRAEARQALEAWALRLRAIVGAPESASEASRLADAATIAADRPEPEPISAARTAVSGLARATHGHGHDGCWLRRGMGLSAMRETSRPS